MKRLLPIFLAVALLVPSAVMAKGKKAKRARAKENVPEWAVETEKCSGDRDLKSVNLGKEAIYLNEGLNTASFNKSEFTPMKHALVYKCPSCDFYKSTPGSCKDGSDLAPSFKHGETWYKLNRDEAGNVVVEGAPPGAPVMASPMDQTVPAKKSGKKGRKGGKKGKKSKKAKKVDAPVEEKKEATK